MSNPRRPRLFRPETLTALGIIAVAVAFMAPTAALKPISAFLPATMLIGMAVLSLFLLLVDQRAAGAGEDAPPMTASPKRVLGAFLMIVCYALSTDYVVAYVFGYRSLPGLALAACIVLGAIYLIFDVAMAQTFPVGRLWKS